MSKPTATIDQTAKLIDALEICESIWHQDNTNEMAEGLAWNARNALKELLVELRKERVA